MRKIPRRMRVAAAKLMTDRALAKLAPIPVPSTGSPEVRLFLGHAGVRGALASAYSFLRYRAFPLIVHEDGTLTGEDWRRIVTLFPGAQLVEARQARSRTMAHLERWGLVRLAEFRLMHPLAPKLLDLQLFAGGGRPTLYWDTDVLAHQEPTALLAAIERGQWTFNADVDTQYALQLPAPLPGVNAGLISFRLGHAEDSDGPSIEELWPVFDAALAMPRIEGQEWYIEQTLWAVAMGLSEGRPLPPEYDVCARHARNGLDVVTQHYCSHQRQFLEERFLADVLGHRGYPVRPIARHVGAW